MPAVENIKISLCAIYVNKIRSFLAMLGVIIGVSAVITLIAMGEGLRTGVTSEIEAIGSNLLAVLPGKVMTEDGLGGMSGLAGVSTLTIDDKNAIKEKIDSVGEVSAIMIISGTFNYQNKEAMPMLVGGEEDLEFANLYNLMEGRFLSEQDVNDKNKVVVIGETIAKDLFGEESALGKKVNINRQEFEVIGLMKTESLSSMGIDANSMATIPISVAQEMFSTDKITRIIMQIKNKDEIPIAQEQIKNLLLDRHNGQEDFSILTQEDMLKMFNKILGLITALLSGIAAISLVVGGIGIMNVMLVSVTERTREIGIRKALGATNGNILIQFLTEAGIIGLFGGGIGILIAWVASFIIGRVSPLIPEITPFAVVLAFSISVGLGIFFGVAPAIKAARKDPIEALRYE